LRARYARRGAAGKALLERGGAGRRDFFLSTRLKTPISVNPRFSEDSESNP
jgi:hypothetical protein